MEIDESKRLDFEFVLLLQAHMLELLSDTVFQNNLIRKLEWLMKTGGCRGIIYRPQKASGVAKLIGEMVIDEWFDYIANGEYVDRFGCYDVHKRIESLVVCWILNDPSSRRLRQLQRDLNKFETQAWQLEKSEANFCFDQMVEVAVQQGGPLLEQTARSLRRSKAYRSIRSNYADALADKLIHDRQLCCYISHQLRMLAPVDSKGTPKRFVTRVKWPSGIARAVIARDRGKCGYCKADIAMELLAKPSLDHIVPISRGGCNDIVNVQLCCDSCNTTKGNRGAFAESSTPAYSGTRYIVEFQGIAY